MAELIDIVNCLFTKRDKYKEISNEDKDKYFFIINRYLSKKWPKEAQKFNIKDIDKSICLDNWFLFLKDSKYPDWFWHKGKGVKLEISKTQIEEICNEHDIKKDDIHFLIKYYPEFIKENLKLIKNK